MLILVINSGRATLKVDVIEFASAGSGPRRLAQARFEQVGCTASCPLSASAGRALEETRAVPEHAATYALPRELVERHDIPHYGFQGLAHESMLRRCSELSGVPAAQASIITLQLGGGCSVAANRQGRSIDTSMGFPPLEGLMIGARAGDIDAGVLLLLLRNENLSVAAREDLLNRQCGLLGVSGRSADMRKLLATAPGNGRAVLAVEMFCYRAGKYVGAFLAALDGAHAVVFGGGIGENSPAIRARICEKRGWFGLRLDDARNEAAVGHEACITDNAARLHAWVVAVNEASLVAAKTAAVVSSDVQHRTEAEVSAWATGVKL